MSDLCVEIAGQPLLLLPEKALYWPAQRCLLLADLHLGKAAAFRRLGQPVPRGTTEANLARLDRVLARHPCERLVVLGDFLHAREALGAAQRAQLAAWRARWPALAVALVRGNHDRHAGDPPAELGIEVVDQPLLAGPFALCHEPQAHPTHHVLAGHLHPAFRLRGRGRQQLRLPCFCSDPGTTLLPAFGDFTGSLEVSAAAGRRLFVVADGAVLAVPGAPAQASEIPVRVIPKRS